MPHAGSTSKLQAIAYRSRAVRNFTAHDLNELVAEASSYNHYRKVTGILLFDGADFFQFLEGPAGSLSDVFSKIRDSSQHIITQVVCDSPVIDRRFDGWHMAVRRTRSSSILNLCESSWKSETDKLGRPDASVGLTSLRSFWRQAGFDD